MQPKIFLLVILAFFFLKVQSIQGQGATLPLSWQQKTYLLDTFAGSQVYQQLINTTTVSLADNGAIKSVVQQNFSIVHPEGLDPGTSGLYYPALSNRFSEKEETNPQLIKMAAEEFFDQTSGTEDYIFEFDKNGNVRSIIGREYWRPKMYFYYDKNNQWTKVVKQLPDERSNHTTYEITERRIQYDKDKPLPTLVPVFLTSNGTDIFQKNRKNIVDYYVLAKLSEIFNPENEGGTFDIPNGFYRNTDEGTGAEIITKEMALFRTSTGQVLIALNEYGSDPWRDAQAPRFYGFENGQWVKKNDVFPEIHKGEIFGGPPPPAQEEQVPAHFILPQRGLAIQFVIHKHWVDICGDTTNQYNFQNKAEKCSWFKQLDRTQANILFDKVSGRFKIVE